MPDAGLRTQRPWNGRLSFSPSKLFMLQIASHATTTSIHTKHMLCKNKLTQKLAKMCELRVIVLVKNKVYLMVRASIYDKKIYATLRNSNDNG